MRNTVNKQDTESAGKSIHRKWRGRVDELPPDQSPTLKNNQMPFEVMRFLLQKGKCPQSAGNKPLRTTERYFKPDESR